MSGYFWRTFSRPVPGSLTDEALRGRLRHDLNMTACQRSSSDEQYLPLSSLLLQSTDLHMTSGHSIASLQSQRSKRCVSE